MLFLIIYNTKQFSLDFNYQTLYKKLLWLKKESVIQKKIHETRELIGKFVKYIFESPDNQINLIQFSKWKQKFTPNIYNFFHQLLKNE